MNLIALALKSVRRHPTKTAIQVTFLGLVVAVTMVDGAVIKGVSSTIENAATELDLGEVQIHAAGTAEVRDLYDDVPRAAELLEQARRLGVAGTPRLYGSALASSDRAAAGVLVRGVDVDSERGVTKLDRHLEVGTWLTASAPKAVVLGRTLARRLGLRVGDTFVLLGQASDGSLANDLFQVAGILRSISPKLDGRGLLMPGGSFRELFLTGNRVHELAFRRHDQSGDARRFVPTLAKLATALGADVDIKSWQQLVPVLARMIDLQQLVILLHLFLTYAALSGLILNQRFMAYLSRRKEYGIMTALGMEGWQIRRLFLMEAMLIAAGAALVGVAIGVPAALYLKEVGIDYRGLADGIGYAGISIDPVLRAQLGPLPLLAPLAFLGVAIPTFSALPAHLASKSGPIEAMTMRG